MSLPDRAHTRPGDPWTSHAAARSIPFEQLRASQRAVYDCFQTNGPMHHDRLLRAYSDQRTFNSWPLQSGSGLRTRTAELVDAGYLRDSGRIVVLPSRRKSIVWEVDDTPAPSAAAPVPATPMPMNPVTQLGLELP